jgi:hypothetical protein
VARLGWFLAGAATAAGVLVAAPNAYNRLRPAVGSPGQEPPADQEHTEPDDFAPATAFAGYDGSGEAGELDEDTAELRLRIDETRQRIRRRAEGDTAADQP